MQNKRVKRPARQALIVLGMHRSGTSALSGVLAKLGARAPATLMPPTPDNPKGYWESSALMQFHDDVLESAGTRWSEWDRFNGDWIDSPVARPFMDRLASLLDQEFDDAALFLVKDPRMCRVMPLWLKVLGEVDIDPKVVIPIRHPSEVFGSLAARDHITRMRAQLIWLRYNLDAEFGSRGITRCFVRYSDLLADWRDVVSGISKTLDLKWPSRSAAIEAEVEAYLSSGLRHHVEASEPAAGSSQIGAWVAAAYQAIDALMDDGDDAEARRKLDRIRQEFDSTSAIYAPVLHEARSGLEQAVGESRRKLADASQELGEQIARHERLKQENQANYELAMTHKAALDDLRERYQNRENAHASMEARCERQQADLIRQQQSHEAEIEKISARHQSELSGMDKKVEEREATRQAFEDGHRAEMAELATRLHAEIRGIKTAKQRAEESVQERVAEIAILTNRVFELEAQVQSTAAGAREAKGALEGQVSRLETRVREAGSRISHLETMAHQADETSRRLAERLGDASTHNQTLRREVEALAGLVADYWTQLENVNASGAWRLAGIARRAVGKAPIIQPALADARQDDQILRGSRLFDGAWYCRRYPDVSARKMDPVRHYLEYGAKEGRDPGPVFSTAGYCTRYPDVVAAGINPLVHYLKYGRKEGRVFSVLEDNVDKGVGKRAAKA